MQQYSDLVEGGTNLYLAYGKPVDYSVPRVRVGTGYLRTGQV